MQLSRGELGRDRAVVELDQRVGVKRVNPGIDTGDGCENFLPILDRRLDDCESASQTLVRQFRAGQVDEPRALSLGMVDDMPVVWLEREEPGQRDAPGGVEYMHRRLGIGNPNQVTANLEVRQQLLEDRVGHGRSQLAQSLGRTELELQGADVHGVAHATDERGSGSKRSAAGQQAGDGGLVLALDGFAAAQRVAGGHLGGPLFPVGGREGLEWLEGPEGGSRDHGTTLGTGSPRSGERAVAARPSRCRNGSLRTLPGVAATRPLHRRRRNMAPVGTAMVFDLWEDHEQILHVRNEAVGLRAIIAVHSTALGQSLGGTRFRPYANERDALVDVMRLSRAMSYKAACAGLALGGGKAVIIGDPATDKSPELFAAYGQAIDSLSGRYVTACDVGTYPEDMLAIGTQTRWVTGTPVNEGGSGDSGILTAYGVFVGLRKAAEYQWGSADLEGRRVAVQGLGKVGQRLVGHLVAAGASVVVADVDEQRVAAATEHPLVTAVGTEHILTADVDILSPNALGAVLSSESIPNIRARVVCGGANNQLAHDEDAKLLADHDILYAPDYVVNAGGIINIFGELDSDGWDDEVAHRRADGIADTLQEVFDLARTEGITTEEAAERIAEERMAVRTGLARWWRPGERDAGT